MYNERLDILSYLFIAFRTSCIAGKSVLMDVLLVSMEFMAMAFEEESKIIYGKAEGKAWDRGSILHQ